MLDEDRDAIRRMKEDFDKLAELVDGNFSEYATLELRMSHYNTVYTAATRNVSKTSDYPGYDAGDVLYMDYQEMLTRYLLRFHNFDAHSDSESFAKVLSVWEHYKVLMNWNMRAFGYLSRYYIVNHSKPSLHQVALSIFLEQIFKGYADVVSRVTQDLLVSERAGTGDPKSSGLIRSAIDMFSSMSLGDTQSIYADKFLRPYLARSRSDYEDLLAQWGATATAAEFLAKIRQALAEEDERCTRYFPEDDRRIILTCVVGVLIDSPITQERLFSARDGLPAAFAQRDRDLLRQYYDFFSRKDAGVKLVADLLRHQIENEGAELSREYGGDETAVNVVAYVTSMMKLQDVFPGLLSTCFQMDFTLSRAVREGLEHAFNGAVKVRSRATGQVLEVPFSEWLAHYVDVILQTGEGSVEEEIERIVSVLAYVTERDRFLVNTRQRMAERILFPLARFDEANERCLIQRIKQRCGPASTAYLEGMLSDVDTSSQFHAMDVLAATGTAPSFEVALLVAKRGIWPLEPQPESPLVLPPGVQSVLNKLEVAYLKDTVGRVFTWAHESSSAELLGHFAQGSCTLVVSVFQALILLAFNGNSAAGRRVEEVMQLTGLTLDVIQRALPPLVKSKLLLRASTTQQSSLQQSDTLTFNSEFSTRCQRVRIPPTLVQVSIAGVDDASRQVHEDRKPVVDACLVRIMKTKQVLEHAELVEQCQRQLSANFTPDVKFIKQRIEDLLRREFIERDASSTMRYRYQA